MRELLPVKVVGRRDLAEDVLGLTLAGITGPLPAWTPGSHIDLVLPSGLVRQYSLCGPLASQTRYEIAILREPKGRGGSVEVHERIQVGTELRITPPKNRFLLIPADEYLFIAGGIGITPLLPMIEAVGNLGRGWHLAYGGRTQGSMAFLDQLDLLNLAGDLVDIVPQDELGILDASSILSKHPRAVIYTCGPSGMIEAVQRAAADARRNPVHFERFVAPRVEAEVGAASSTGTAGTAFEVQLGSGGPVLNVPTKASILEVVLAAGVDCLFSCEEGTCGSCETTVLDGEVDHRDQLLTDEERAERKMLICVSRSRSSRLVLDLSIG